MRFAGWCFFCVAFCLIASRVDAATGRRPNVIVIYSDDQGTLDLNCYGSKDLHTPHLDRLAERGVRMPISCRLVLLIERL